MPMATFQELPWQKSSRAATSKPLLPEGPAGLSLLLFHLQVSFNQPFLTHLLLPLSQTEPSWGLLEQEKLCWRNT